MEGLLGDDEIDGENILEEADINPQTKTSEEFSPTQNVLLSQKEDMLMESQQEMQQKAEERKKNETGKQLIEDDVLNLDANQEESQDSA